MKKRQTEIRKKIINHLTKNGKKHTAEKILNKSIKTIQKSSNKLSKEIVQLALIYSLPTFKIHKILNKQKRRGQQIKEIPAFISNKHSRTSLSIKYILNVVRKNKSISFYMKLKNELLTGAQNKNNSITMKDQLQKSVLLNRRFLTYFRWT